MHSRGPSAARVAGKYSTLSYLQALPDRYYWGFEGDEGGPADKAAVAMARSVRLSNDRLVELGLRVHANITRSIEAQGGVDAKVRAEVEAGILQMRAFAKVEWFDIARQIRSYSKVDVDPYTSRIGCYMGYQSLYRKLAERASHPSMVELRKLYQKLMVLVYKYFLSV